MSDEPDSDPFLDAEVETSLAPYRARGLSPELLEEMERMLRLALTWHEAGKHLMSQLRPRVVDESGTARTTGLRDEDKARSA